MEMDEVLDVRIRNAVSLRAALGLPSALCTAYRLINGEGDRLGGLIVDVFGDRIVVQSCALWVELRRDLIVQSISAVFGPGYEVLWRRAEARLRQDGFNATSAPPPVSSEGSEPPPVSGGGSVVVLERGVRFSVDTESSQKTGFYCDQRDSRAAVGALSRGKTVLDLYCYSAGFSMHAAVNGAARCS